MTDGTRRPKPFLMRKEAEPEKVRHRRSHQVLPQKHEATVAKSLGGKTTPGSGAFAGHKGDVRVETGVPLLVECKRTMGLTLDVKVAWLAKITGEASRQGKRPALAIQFDAQALAAASRDVCKTESDWIMVPLSTFRALLESAGEEDIRL